MRTQVIKPSIENDGQSIVRIRECEITVTHWLGGYYAREAGRQAVYGKTPAEAIGNYVMTRQRRD